MTKVSRKPIDPGDLKHHINDLWNAFTLANTKSDIRLLFKDLFTPTEYKMFAKRFQIARELLSKNTYEDICDKLGVTAGTVSTISNTLAEKGNGYRKAHDSISALEEKQYRNEKKRTRKLEKSLLTQIHRKTVLGSTIKAGLAGLDKLIVKKIKEKSTKKELDL